MVQVIPREDENFEETLIRFRRAVRRAYERPWHKRRYGYYEKPGALRRKKNRTRDHNRRGAGIRLCIDLEDQFQRDGPSNAMGR
ncbi:MAG: 30S ribosomal protein S21 [Chloroflexi bacterium]|nr:30S ribosomal protein S21 [Chloroflexota bacterium]